MKPFMSYYGGKWRQSKTLPAPQYSLVIEPFAGSGGYSVRHEPEYAVLSDSNEHVVSVWSYLIRASEADILTLPDLLPGQSVDDLNIPQEARWLIGFWCNAAVASPAKSLSAWALRYAGGSQLFWGERVRQRVASQLQKIRKWRAVLGSYETLNTSVEATWFVDPPYQCAAGRHYPHNKIDYKGLAAWCRGLRGQVIVCEQTGANWLPFVHHKNVKSNSGPRGKGYSPEAVWLKP